MNSRYLHVTYCDDIRQEVGNKLSLLGIFRGTLFVPSFPVTLPKLAILVAVATDVDEPFQRLEVRVEYEDQVVASTGDLIASIEEANAPSSTIEELDDSIRRRMEFQLAFVLSPFHVEKPSKIRIAAETENGVIRGNALLIRGADSSRAMDQA